jgi:hypothetical protein
LRHDPIKQAFQIQLANRFEALSEEGSGAEEQWQDFKSALATTAMEICGRRERKQAGWWNDEVRERVNSKRDTYLKCLATSEGSKEAEKRFD